jgi:hypothetical protein
LTDGNFVFIIANILKIHALIDTGASRSCVGSTFAKQLKLTQKTVKTGDAQVSFSADNSAIKTEGTVDIDLKIQGLVIQFEFTMIQNLNQKLNFEQRGEN